MDEQQRRRAFDRKTRASRTPTEAEIAQTYRSGPEQEGVSQSAGLTGGSDVSQAPSQKKLAPSSDPKEKSQPSHNTDEQNAAAPTPEPTEEARGGDVSEEQGNLTRQQKTQQAIKEQQATLGGTRGKIDETKKKLQQQTEEKRIGRIFTKQRLKALEAKKKAQQRQLARLGHRAQTQLASGTALKAAWLGLIETWGLSWFYIAFHFLMAYFTPLSDFFVKFGEEWLPKTARAAGGDTAKQATKGLELVEVCGCVGIGYLLAAVLFFIVILLAIIVWIWHSPLEALVAFGPQALWEGIKCLFGQGYCRN